MGISQETQRKEFYNELSQEKQREYFNLKEKKFLPTIDNLYYSVFICEDNKDNIRIERWLKILQELKDKALISREPIDYKDGLMFTIKGYSFYRFCLTDPDLYDIFICATLPSDETPRIVVQLRAFGLWLRGIEEILTESFNKLSAILSQYDCIIEKCRESRIDYCYHTNIVSSPNKIFKETAGRVKHVYSNLSHALIHADLERVGDGMIFHKDYVCFGKKESNNVRARVYDKVKEVIEMGYKGFFFKLWHDNGLISYYDMWCMEYALPYKNMDYLNKARLAFYVEHGTKEEKRKEYADALSNETNTLAQLKNLADEYMPKSPP